MTTKTKRLPKLRTADYSGFVRNGAGGAAKSFLRDDALHQREIAAIVGYTPHPGTLNVMLTERFDFSRPHLTGRLSNTAPDVYFYPVSLNGIEGHVIRLAVTKLRPEYVGVIAAVRLRDFVVSNVGLSHR